MVLACQCNVMEQGPVILYLVNVLYQETNCQCKSPAEIKNNERML